MENTENSNQKTVSSERPVVAEPTAQAPIAASTSVAPAEVQPDAAGQRAAPVEPGLQVSQNEKVFATVGYVGPLFVLPLVAQPKSEYCKFHAKQSMGLLALFFVQLIILVIIPLIGSLITFVIFAAYILSMYNAFMGKMWRVPVVGSIFQKIDFDKFLAKAGSSITNMNVVKEKANDLTNAVGNAVSSVTNQANTDISKPAEPTSPEQTAVKK